MDEPETLPVREKKRVSTMPSPVRAEPRGVPWSTPLLVLIFAVMTVRDVSRGSIALGITPRAAEITAIVNAIGGPIHTARVHVIASDRHVIGGATVRAILVLEGRSYPLGEAVTDDDGNAALPQLPEGSYWFLTRAPTFARAVETVRVGHNGVAPINVTLAPGTSISGTVTRVGTHGNPDEPIAGIVVRAMNDLGGDGPPYGTRSDPSGNFVLDGLPPGNYRIEVADPNYEPIVRRQVPAPIAGLVLALREMARITGLVRNEGAVLSANAQVILAGSGIWPPRSTAVRPDGRFEIVGIPSGVYELRAVDGDQVAEPIAPLVLDPGDVRDAQLLLTAGATLSGIIVDAVTQRAIAHARVVIAEDALATVPRAIISDENGAFHASGLLHRPHQVSARAEGYVPRIGTLAIPGDAALTIPLDRGVTVTGRVIDTHGAPIAGAQLEVMAQDLDGRQSWVTGQSVAFRDALFATQLNGPRPLVPSGELGVMPGPVPVIPVAPAAGMSSFASNGLQSGYVTDTDGRFSITDVPPGVVTLVASHPAYVRATSDSRTARAGETLALEIVLHEGGTIDGRLVDERGFPIPGQSIEVRSLSDPMPRRVFTRADGTFRVPAVLGHVAIVALVDSRVGARAEADVADGAIVPITLTLERGLRRIAGRIVDTHGYPIGAAEITIASTNRAVESIRSISSPDGTFDRMLTGTGALTLDVRHPNFAPRSMQIPEASTDLTVTLDDGGSLNIDVIARECATGDVSLEVRTPCGPYRRSLHTTTSWQLDHLCPGNATIVASAPGCVHSERTELVTAGSNAHAPTINLSAGGSATGDVTDSLGEPVPGAVVTLASDDGVAVARSGRRGEFSITDLPEGDQSLVATHPALGRSRTAPVRVIRGSIARAVLLRFDRDLASASTAQGASPVTLTDRYGHVEVAAVTTESAASRAGLQTGDQVTAVRGNAVHNAAEATSAMSGEMGDEITFDVIRDGVTRTVRWTRENGL